MKLSIIIPFYNIPQQYTDELLECLDKQINPLGDTVTMNPDVEVILIDDGSKTPYKPTYPWLKVIRQKNKGAGATRNKGIEKSKGEYITFIDADDMVAPNYIQSILDKIEGGFDVCDMSWKSLTHNGVQFNYKLKSDTDRLSNPSVCTRVFNRSYIGTVRFSEVKDAAEDEDFSRRLGYLTDTHKHTAITEYMYFYRTEVSDSNTKTFKQGLRKTKRIVYYYDRFKADMTEVLEQIKKDDEQNEVILLTNHCEVREVDRYAQILKPTRIWTHYLKGEPYRNIDIIPIPVEAQVILFIRQLNVIGGIESFIYHFMATLSADYDIVLITTNIPIQQRLQYEKYGTVIDYNPNVTYSCDTLIMLRILDTIPANIKYNQSVQMCHACRTSPVWHIPQNSDYIVNVSQASKDSFLPESQDGIVIHNPITKSDKRALMLVSATRIPAPDKGKDYEQRMRTLAQMLNDADIPFVWFNFSEGQIPNPPQGMVNMGLRMDIQPYIARADYLVQLSDSEAWSYSILEALTNNTPVIVCPFPSAIEMGVVDGQNGYIVPFDMIFDVHCLLNVPQFTYDYDNAKIVSQWKQILKPGKRPKQPKQNNLVTVRVCSQYYDIALKRDMVQGEIVNMTPDRVRDILKVGRLIEVMGG